MEILGRIQDSARVLFWSQFGEQGLFVANNPSDTELISRVANGDQNALAELFSQHRDRLWRLVTFRMDPRLHGRVDADDILQLSLIHISKMDRRAGCTSR